MKHINDAVKSLRAVIQDIDGRLARMDDLSSSDSDSYDDWCSPTDWANWLAQNLIDAALHRLSDQAMKHINRAFRQATAGRPVD